MALIVDLSALVICQLSRHVVLLHNLEAHLHRQAVQLLEWTPTEYHILLCSLAYMLRVLFQETVGGGGSLLLSSITEALDCRAAPVGYWLFFKRIELFYPPETLFIMVFLPGECWDTLLIHNVTHIHVPVSDSVENFARTRIISLPSLCFQYSQRCLSLNLNLELFCPHHPRGHLPVSGNVFGCQKQGAGCYWHPVGRGQGCC